MAKAKDVNKDLQILIDKAMQYAGVADVMKVYGDYQQILQATRDYFSAMDPQLMLSTTDSSS